jgi:hypothetical protein
MKRIILVILTLMLFSCNNNNEELNLEISRLKKANDSLSKITNSLKDKFVFDEARVKIIPSENNTNKIGSEYNGVFVVVAYNKNDNVEFSTEFDKGNGFDLANPEILKRDFDGYHFKMKLKEKENDIHFRVNIKSKIGRNFNGLTISDKKIAH